MKTKLIFANLILGCLFAGSLTAQSQPALAQKPKTAIVFEITPGTGSAIEAKSGIRWKPQVGLGIGAHIHHSPSQRVWLHAGLSEQFGSAYRLVEHPYPYAMEMRVTTAVNSTRLRAGGDYALIVFDAHNGFLYVGSALFADVVHDATAYKRIRYVNETERETIKIEDYFASVVPGIQFSLGAQFNAVRLELRYWEDLKTYKIPTVPIGRLRRSFVGLNGSIMLTNRLPMVFSGANPKATSGL